jgi:probable rRNA maturation factor
MNVVIANRQRTKKINARQLKQIVGGLFAELKITEAELGIHLVTTPEMALVNETFLRHKGATDVITFDHSSPESGIRNSESKLHGELFVCVDVAIAQAEEFRTRWQVEVVRYVVHGVLHLLGHDDRRATARRRMKRAENRLVRALSRRFSLAQIHRAPKIGA